MRPSRPAHRWLTLLTALLVGLSIAGCSFDFANLQFSKDQRLTILTPKPNTLVRNPVHLAWRIHGFTVASPHSAPPGRNDGYFAVFVDRSPVRPGQTLAAVNANQPGCGTGNYCSTRGYLANEQIYTTAKDHLTLPTVADLAGNNLSTQYHTATIVLMDTAGHRIGESAWSVQFKMHALSTG